MEKKEKRKTSLTFGSPVKHRQPVPACWPGPPRLSVLLAIWDPSAMQCHASGLLTHFTDDFLRSTLHVKHTKTARYDNEGPRGRRILSVPAEPLSGRFPDAHNLNTFCLPGTPCKYRPVLSTHSRLHSLSVQDEERPLGPAASQTRLGPWRVLPYSRTVRHVFFPCRYVVREIFALINIHLIANQRSCCPVC